MLANHAWNAQDRLFHLCLAIILKDTGEFLGCCGLDFTRPEDADSALFYLFMAEHWGKGLATEAAQALLDAAFTQFKPASIHSGAAAENYASRRVMEKLGMRYAGPDAEGGAAFTLTREAYFAARWKGSE